MTVFVKREVARRVFAKELMNSTHTIREGTEKSPIYVLTPLGLKCNRVFIIGALTQKDEIGEDGGIYRIRITDQTGSFIGYVGRYQPEAYEALEEIDVLNLVALTAKVRVFEGSRGKLVTLRPEAVSLADTESRDYWVIETARQTIERIRIMEEGKSELAKLAMEVYRTNLEEYKRAVREAIERLLEDYGRVEEIEEEEEFELEEEEITFEEEEIDLTKLLED